MKVSELSGAQLDWAVAKAEGIEHYFDDGSVCLVGQPFDTGWRYWTPSSDWAQGGPIIQRERIRLDPRGVWVAGHDSSNDEYLGPTPLVAAMRCYVASKLGDETDLPVEIRGHEKDCPAVDGFGCKCEEA
jgi:hypothetical protein